MPHERQEAEADRLQDEPDGERGAGTEAVDDRPGADPGGELCGGGDGDREPGRPQPEPTHVVQVDDEERQHDAVPERVDDAAGLEQPHLAGKLGVKGAK